MGSCSVNIEFQFCKMKKFKIWCALMRIVNMTELYLQMVITVNFMLRVLLSQKKR